MAKVIKTISTIAAVTTTLIIIPASKNIEQKDLATSLLNNKVVQVQASPVDQGTIYNNMIKVENVWGQSLFDIQFNEDNTLKITKGWSQINPYSHENFNITITNDARKVLKSVTFKGGAYPENEIYSELNGFKFAVGDFITMSSGTGTEYFINNGSKQDGFVSYKITQEGLSQVTAKAENVVAVYNGDGKVDISCIVKPNIMVDFVCNDKVFTIPSNEQGMVSGTIEGNYGDTVYIYPVDELETQVKVGYNKKDFVLQNQSIDVNNVWNQSLFSIGFTYDNKFVVKSGWSQTNPYYTGPDSLTVQLLNNKGEEIYSEVFKGGISPDTAIEKMLNGKSFEYGDLIHIESNSGANIKVGNDIYKDDMYFQLNKSGLTYLKATNTTYKAEYNGTNTIVTGIVSPNSNITIVAGGKNYKGKADSNGNFKMTLSNTTKSDQNIQIIDSNGVTQTVKIMFDTAKFGILNSEIKVINGWGSDAINIKFNPETMTINTSGWNQYLGSSMHSPFIEFGLYNGTTGNKIKNVMLQGADSSTSLTNAINNLGFNFGDIVELSYNNKQGNVQIYNGSNSIGNITGTVEYF